MGCEKLEQFYFLEYIISNRAIRLRRRDYERDYGNSAAGER